MGVFKELTEGGFFTMPFLLHIYDDQFSIYLIDDNVPLNYGGKLYQAAAFSYSPNTNGDATLDIELMNNAELKNIIHRSRRFNCDLIGAYRGGEVVALSAYKHKYGEATWDGDKFNIKLDADDRGNMTFPALIYNSYNNRGAQ